MSKLNTLSGGYKGGSPRTRSNNNIKPFSGELPKQVDVEELSNQIKQLYSGGNISKEGIQVIIKELNKLVL
tara:strand:- start:335 stop:547 length:213 start_codon:yes stop_codon:yes gene_type:complete